MNNSDYRERMLSIADELTASGVSRYSVAPPLYRLMWRLGLRIKPPLYQSFGARFVANAIPFAIAMMLFRLLFPALSAPSSVRETIFVCGFSGLLVGLMMALTLARQARHIDLPPLP